MKKKLFLIISIVIMAIGVGTFIAAAVLSLTGKSSLGDIFFGVSSLCGIAALALLIYTLAISSKDLDVQPVENKPRVVVKVVDVKDVPKSKEEKLYEQYENLFKQGLITQEDLDKKRKELLGK